MKILKLWSLIFVLLYGLGACDDDDNNKNGNGGVTPEPVKVTTAFEQSAKTVLKNTGKLQIPVVLENAATEQVKVTIGVKEATGDTIAKEGIDFEIVEKIIVIEKGQKIGNVEITLYNDEKAALKDKVFELEIKGVYGGGKKAVDNLSCKISIVSNAFVEFEKAAWQTYEAAAVNGNPNVQSRFIPLVITGAIKEPAKVVLEVTDETAKEYVHFTLVSKEITINPGDDRVMVEILPIDDNEANPDRNFSLAIKEIIGGNLIIGKNNISSNVSIISEEVLKIISFEETSFTVKDNERELIIPIVLDKPADQEVEIEIKAKSTSTAVENVDYQITEGTVRIPVNGTRAEAKVRIISNNAIEDDRVLELQFKKITGLYIKESEVANLCKIKIENDDFPSFTQAKYEVEEDYGNYTLTINLPPVNKVRTLKVGCTNYEETPGLYFTVPSTEIVVPANATTANLNVTIGTNPEQMAAIMPVLKVKVTEVDGYALNQTIQSEVNVVECTYRKMLGAWTMTPTGLPTGWPPKATYAATFSGGNTAAIRAQNFNKELICVIPKFAENSYDVTYRFTFDKVTKTVKMILNVDILAGKRLNFGGTNTNVEIRVLRYPAETDTSPFPFVFDPVAMTLTDNTPYLQSGGFQNGTGSRVLYYFFINTVTFVKNK